MEEQGMYTELRKCIEQGNTEAINAMIEPARSPYIEEICKVMAEECPVDMLEYYYDMDCPVEIYEDLSDAIFRYGHGEAIGIAMDNTRGAIPLADMVKYGNMKALAEMAIEDGYDEFMEILRHELSEPVPEDLAEYLRDVCDAHGKK